MEYRIKIFMRKEYTSPNMKLPKCTLWELENDPLMIDFNKQLIYVPKVVIVSSKHPIFVFQREILK